MKQNATGTESLVLGALEREQRRIGEQIHDQLSQTLSSALLLLETISRAVKEGRPLASDQLAQLRDALEKASDETRTLAHRFNPVHLEEAGLMNQLQQLTAAAPNCAFRCEKPVFVSDPDTALVLYRIAQEALQNAVAHARATGIELSLESTAHEILLQVRDDGCGFDAHLVTPPGSGFRIMKMRASSVGGTLQIDSACGHGTRITCRIPTHSEPGPLR